MDDSGDPTEELARCHETVERIFDPPRADTDEVAVSFDWIPSVTNNRLTFCTAIIRGNSQSSVEFEIDLGRLNTGELEALHRVLSRRQAGIDSGWEIAQTISWLLDLSLQQSSHLNLHERQAAVRQMLLIP